MFVMPPALKAQIEAEARAVYPHECCGIMLGIADGERREVSRLIAVQNDFELDERYHRFKIEPETIMRAEKEARRDGIEVVGFYHSHPDHPAVPSDYDRSHALPFYAYVIVAVTETGAGDFRCWFLKEDRSGFEEEGVDYVN